MTPHKMVVLAAALGLDLLPVKMAQGLLGKDLPVVMAHLPMVGEAVVVRGPLANPETAPQRERVVKAFGRTLLAPQPSEVAAAVGVTDRLPVPVEREAVRPVREHLALLLLQAHL
jgi:hypothetical protein